MQGREFLDLALETAGGGTEKHWRGAAGRAYYALFLECRDALTRWGIRIPPRDNIHHAVRHRFLYVTDRELKAIGYDLDLLVQLRVKADYNLSSLPEFASDVRAQEAIRRATDALAVLDAIEADPPRLAAAVAAIRAAFP